MEESPNAKLKSIAQFYSNLMADVSETLSNDQRRQLNLKASDYNKECRETLDQIMSKRIKGIELLTLAEIFKSLCGLYCIDSRTRLRIKIAKAIDRAHERGSLSLEGCTAFVLSDLANNLISSYKHGSKNSEIGKAANVLADILNEKYLNGELERYPLQYLSSIAYSSYSWCFTKEFHVPIEHTILNIARIIIKLHSRSELVDNTGIFVAELGRVFDISYRRNKSNVFLSAICCIAQFLISQYNIDELVNFDPKSLTQLLYYIGFTVADGKEESVLIPVLSVLAKAINYRFQIGLIPYETIDLLNTLRILSELMPKLEDKSLFKCCIKNLSEALYNNLKQINYKIAIGDIKILIKIIGTCSTLSEKDDNDFFQPVVLASAELVLKKHTENRLQLSGINNMIDFLIGFNLCHNREEWATIHKAVLATANAFITKSKKLSKTELFENDYSSLVGTFSNWKEYDDRKSIKTAVEIIADIIIEYYNIEKTLPYELKSMCVLMDGFTKWYDDSEPINKAIISITSVINTRYQEFSRLIPNYLSILANYIKCYDSSPNVFNLGINRIVQTIRLSDDQEEFSIAELSSLASAFVDLFSKNDVRNTVRDAMICIAQRFISTVCVENNEELGFLHEYLPVFANAFSVWCEYDSEEKLFKSAIEYIADLVWKYYDRNNLTGFKVSHLSIICKAFRKFPLGNGIYEACSAIAESIVKFYTEDLFTSDTQCLVILLKTFSYWCENKDEGEYFKRCSEAIGQVTFVKISNSNYVMENTCDDLANLIFSYSKWYMYDTEQHMQNAAIAIAICINNEYEMKRGIPWRLNELAKFIKACSHWQYNSHIQKNAIYIAAEVNDMDKNVLVTCKKKYLNYFISGFEKFFSVNFDEQCLKCLALAASHIVQKHEIEDLKEYDEDFLSHFDQYLSRFSDDWNCLVAVIIIRQLNEEEEIILGKSVFDTFAEARMLNEEKLKIWLRNDAREVSKFAVACEQFLYLDDFHLTLRTTLRSIAKYISDDFLEKHEKSSNTENFTNADILYKGETLFNFFHAFSSCPEDKDIQKGMLVISNCLLKCENNITDMFNCDNLLSLTSLLRAWCDTFPGFRADKCDLALEMVSKAFYQHCNEFQVEFD
ncbi:hypothetical protein C0J52_12191 [Blattella germanica]|nr:hypothetical protein C0J52_12191 [Blattella germanica]